MTLTDVLVRAATRAPDRGVVHVGDAGTERLTTHAELYADALRIAGGLRREGLAAGDCLLVVAEDSAEFLPLFWGAVLAGVVPVPLPPEPARLAAVATLLGGPPLAGDAVLDGARVLSASTLRRSAPLAAPVPVTSGDLAMLQFSSGSTATPKGVELTHANLVANLEQAARASALDGDDVVVTWMPYFHDMGLIGTHLVPLHRRCRQVRLSPLTFAKRPETWLRTAEKHRATVLSAANFALALTVRRVAGETLDGIDLSSVRLMMVGAEPISPAVWRTFADTMARSRLDPRALRPVYGLAEASVAVAFTPPGELARPLRLSRAALARGVAVDAAADTPAVELMDAGRAVPGCRIRIVDEAGRPVEDGLVGHIQVRGPNVTRGYHLDPAASAAALADGWLRTGDTGFLRAGRLCVTGREKDVVFVHGRTFHACDLEEVAAATPGLGAGPVAVVGATDPASGRERVVVFLAAPAVRAVPEVGARVRARVAEALGYDGVEVRVVPNGAFARTTSGKLRRQAMRERIGADEIPAPLATPAAPPVAPPSPGRMPESRADMERTVRAVWSRVLRIPQERIGPADRFLAIGGSSLAAMEVLAALEDTLGRTLDPVLLRDCATVPALADRLLAAPPARPAPGPAPSTEPTGTELAVISMACRFPDADTPEEFWRNLLAGRDSVAPVTRWPGGGHGAFLGDPALFDAGFFGIDDAEARYLDPHARIFLELAYEALERAGLAGPRRHERRIGVFAAVGESGYAELVARSGAAGPHAMTGTMRGLLPARVAHLLDLRGPALAVDTACSSALVALHLAYRSLAAGDCDVAVVGGVNLHLTPTGERLLGGAQALSPTGRCRAFAADADGFVPGEGGAALVLTRLGDADGDRVLAVVRGTAVNNDGRSLSLMAPNPLRQREVIARAYRDCGVDPAEVSYVEAHGTGTVVGDPVEAQSLAYAFPPAPDGRARLLGSVKTNIGHLLHAAGLPGLVKVVLALRHRELPPSLHHDRPSPRFDLAGAGFEVVTSRRPWAGPAVAGINGFGFGGTNAHAILATPPVPTPESVDAGPADGPHLLTLSARSAVALRAAAGDLAEHLRTHSGLREADVCATASTARDDGPYRVALVADGDLAGRLAAAASGPPVGRAPRVALLFGGQGTQRPGQGAALYASAPRFRAVLDEVSAAAGPVAGRTLREWCTDPAVPAGDLARTEITQPLVVAFGLAQAAQLLANGIRPEAVTGHSIGELAAAATAGMLTPVEAVLLAAERGRLTAELATPGAMVAVAADAGAVAPVLDAGVVLAADNGTHQVVLAGPVEAVEEASRRLAALGIDVRRLAVSHAFHSPSMAPVAGPLGRLAPAVRIPKIPLLSTVTGDWGAAYDAAYLAAQAVRPVRFAAAVDRLRGAGFDTFVEVGASVALAPLIPAATVRPAGGDARALLATAGDLWQRGAPLDRTRLDAGTRWVELPTYPFQRRRYWVTDGTAASATAEPSDAPSVLATPRWVDAPLAPAAARSGDPADPDGSTATATAPVTVVTAGPATVDDVGAAAARVLADAPRSGHLLVVTEDVHVTGAGAERPNPVHAVWVGLAMALADESPGLGVRIVDLSSTDPAAARRDAVARESADPPVPGPARLVAWRGGRRLERRFAGAAATGPVSLPPDGRYLIVGGAGAAGTAVARDLARRGRPHLVLAGRSEAPAALLDELRALGAAVEYRRADVSVEADVVALVAGHEFDVVVHAAGVVRPGSLRSGTPAEIAAELAAKVRGTRLLAEALREQDPLVVALSSVSSVLPGLAGALGAYVAGNAHLDAFAAAERAAGRRFVAVNLPMLTGGGLAAAQDLVTGVPAAAGDGLPLDRLPETLWTAVAVGASQVLVSAPRRPPEASGVPASAPRMSETGALEHSTTTAGIGYDEIVTIVRDLLAGPLGVEAATIGIDEPFLNLGLDSLTAVDLVKKLEARLGRTCSTTLFFEHRTVGDVARHLAAAADFPLSPVQRAFVTTGRLYPGVPAYASVRQTVTGPVDPDRLGRAFAELERRHPMLRVRFHRGGQRFTAPGTGRPAWFGVTTLAEPVETLDAALRNRLFDLTREAPIRAVLAVAGPELSHLLVVAHHAAADGYSLAILGDELWALYSGQELPTAPAATFADHEAARSAPDAADLAYWREALAAYPGLALPFDGDAGSEPEPPYAVQQVTADPALTARLSERARDAGVSPFHLLLAGYVRCLSRWSGQSAVPVMVARAGRTARLTAVERMVGPFADTLPVLAELRPGESALALAGRLRDAWLDSERHDSVSTVDLARMLAADGAAPRAASPASFSFARFPDADGTSGHVVATTAGTASAATRLGLVCFEAHGALHFSWNYPTSLFTTATVERFAAEHLAEIGELAGAASPPVPVAMRIRRQCRRSPEAVAVLTEGVPLTYGDLDTASDRLAVRLAATGARRIGLLTGPGAGTVVGVVAILKAGAAWVPLDASYPAARLAAQLARAGVGVVVHDDSTRDAAGALGDLTLIETRDGADGTPSLPAAENRNQTPQNPPAAENRNQTPVLPVTTGPDDDAYVIFTSGSTGRPKGVVVHHRAMANYLDWAVAAFGYRAGDRLAQTASICFDASVRQLLAPLLVGATVVAWDRDTVRDPGELLSRVERDRITVWSSVPTLWERLLGAAEKRARRPDLSALRWVHVGGEELSAAHVRRWFDLVGPGARLANLYGPTETTINATAHVIDRRPGDDEVHVPIGRPIGGALAEVIGPDGRRCGPGEVGELHIGGVGVAAGYLDDPELTAAAFVDRDGHRWYRSGDRAHRDRDGVLWFRGRVDDQVKLHGYRVEPGEVEAVLRGHPAVDRSAVRVDDGRLVAWVQPRGDLRPGGAELRTYLEELLPPYLVPARIEVVAALPLTATGKVDRALLAPGGAAAGSEAPPATATERLLAEVWSSLLGVPQVGRDDDFFALGGDSIGVLDLFARLEPHLPALPRPTVVYRHRTLAALAAAIDAAGAEPAEPPEPAALAEPAATDTGDDAEFPLTPGQRGYLLADAVGAPSAWLAAPRLHGPLDPERFQRAVDVLVARHPMLRTAFRRDARPPTQHELPPSVRVIVGYDPAPGPLAAELDAERAHRFDPARWPLVRLRLLRVGAQEHVLVLHAHHLVGDGYSVALLARELLAVYDRGADALPPLRSTFRDYAALLDRLTAVPVENDGNAFGPVVTTGFTLPAAVTAGLRHRGAAAGVTPFVPVLAAYRKSLATVTGQPDPLVGVAVTGRDHALPDLGRIFGPCATAVAVRPAPAGDGGDLRRTAAAVLQARTRTFIAPRGWRFFFTYLDFDALGPPRGETLRLSWDDADAELAVPPGTETLLAVRPVDGGLRLTLRGRATPDTLDRLAADLRSRLEHAAGPRSRRDQAAGRLDAALVGYLPAPAHLAALAGDLPAEVRDALPNLDREGIRAALFPDGGPRLLETTLTPLGRSGFVCLPRFADELTGANLAAHSAAAVDLAAAHGARSASLAGMIPSLTGYGTGVARHVRSAGRVTSGHAVTAASVVRTTLAAVTAGGRRLADVVVAVVGVGSIGTASLRLLLARAGQAPAGLLLCDLLATAGRLAELAAAIVADGYAGPIDVVTAGPAAPDPVYRSDVIVAATSGGPGILDVDRLRPGTVVVDDSFPHCFDTGRALARMRDRRDVLVVGGGLLHCGPVERTIAAGLPAVARPGLPGTVASCQLESLLHATTPGLPLVCGPVGAASAAAYWDALDAAGVRAAPLHLLDREVRVPMA
ncbi:non-ribosomal peptide synthetase/type I polyketide synthase [Couchioplanes caeruleus]|uniref:Amino acid adenylation domain-containing protein n=2 Tax=Couchioplanes caeruleus TaxID=56438 RepID=A0A3N1GEW7_9ACTN|nr:non-ribosomal peptide synthetase/type I polyketide synthase [Couchioplanes caeruleus]ROP28843.1 amino acid adenylation domain-containing protein [Couchioplanes caeruleus]